MFSLTIILSVALIVSISANVYLYLNSRKPSALVDYLEKQPTCRKAKDGEYVFIFDDKYLDTLASCLKAGYAIETGETDIDVKLSYKGGDVLYPYRTMRLFDEEPETLIEATYGELAINEKEGYFLSLVSLDSLTEELCRRSDAAVIMYEPASKKKTTAGLKVHVFGHDYKLYGMREYLYDNLPTLLNNRRNCYRGEDDIP